MHQLDSDDAVNALRDRLDRVRDAADLTPGDRVEAPHGQTLTVDCIDEWNMGREVCINFKETPEPWFGAADTPFVLANR